MDDPRSTKADLLVVGAGAAGLWAAARAAELGLDVLLLEKTRRTGTKVLASGGTRCNLTTTLDAEEAGRLFGPRGERFLRRALRTLGPGDVRERFHALGVPTVEEALDKVFPASGRARDVRDALERWASGGGVRLVTDARVMAVEPRAEASGESGWRVRSEDGRAFEATLLALCPGGRSYPRTGTTGDGYTWLEALELELVPPVPALVPLLCAERWVTDLAGIALQAVGVRLLGADGRVLGRRDRPVLFTHLGVSGPGAMDLSEPVARWSAEHDAGATEEARGRELRLALDTLPELEREDLRERLIAGAGRPGSATLQRFFARELPGRLPRGLLHAVAQRAGLADGRVPVQDLDRARRHALVETLKRLEVPIHGTRGFDAAEVTAGGLALRAVDPGSMAVRGRPGLFVFGELLDLQGPIGGLNFQAAFSTAELAARAAAGAVRVRAGGRSS